MLRHLLFLSILTAILSRAASPALALDQTTPVHTGGIGRAIPFATAAGRTSDDGLAHPGLRANSPGHIGTNPGGSTIIGTSRSADESYHPAGLGKIITAGLGPNTMETVPGRSPVYMPTIGSIGLSAQIGSR